MRVITGTAKGRRLETLPGEDIIRPTSDKIKGAAFNSIQFDIEGRRALDLFAGSGQLGIEALSRGAGEVFFIDSNRDAVKIINKNIESCGFLDNSRVFNTDALSFLKTTKYKFDIIFIDPPYNSGLTQTSLKLSLNVISDGGIMVVETSINENLPYEIGSFKTEKVGRYSKTKLSIYRYSPREN